MASNLSCTFRTVCGYAVDIAPDGEEGLYLAESTEYDMIVLDLMLPKMDGLTLLRTLRKKHFMPVLVLTARSEKSLIAELLNAGADDYLTKPFDLGELVARSRALVRGGEGQPSPVLRVGNLEVNTLEKSVKCGCRRIQLTCMEYRILEYLAHRPRAVISKTELLEHLYDFNCEKFSNVLGVYIFGLRHKLGKSGALQIQTIRGQGYVLRE